MSKYALSHQAINITVATVFISIWQIMTTYIYEPLDHSKAQIRLVTIPGLGNLDESAPLHISIHIVTIPRRCLKTSLESALQSVDLNYEDSDIEKPDFLALSYVWGSPDDPSEVFVDSAPQGANTISITRNLDVALRTIRSSSDQPEVFWIDAICIDQGNLEERSYQVAFMDSIYTVCRDTIVWLGPEADDSDHAVDILLHVGQRVSVKGDGTMERHPGAPPRRLKEPIWESLDEPMPFGDFDMRALTSFFERPWFTRMWVRQEIALGKRAIILCGTRVLPWDIFEDGARCLMRKEMNPSLPRHLHNRYKQTNRIVINIYYASYQAYHYETLRMDNRDVSCTDPRDMIYGVRSLLSKQDKKLGVQPNYTLEAADVFMDVCVQIVERQSRTYFLTSCEVSSVSVPNLPSWVPDWSTEMTAITSLQNPWSACGFISAKAAYLGDKVLGVSGIPIDEITSIRDLYDYADDAPYKDKSVLITHIWRCCPGKDRIHSPYDQKQSMLDAYCRTFTGDRFFETWYAAVKGYEEETFDKLKETLWKIWSMDEDLTELNNLATDPLIETFIRKCSSCWESCLFITKDGYIGLSPPVIELGDIISVILGCDFPVILRKDPSSTTEPDGTRWKIVGACYTNGLMSGQAIYGSLPSHYRAVHFDKAADDERICGRGCALLDSRTNNLKTDPAAVLEEFGIKPSSWTREPHRLEVSDIVLRDAGVKLQDFLLV